VGWSCNQRSGTTNLYHLNHAFFPREIAGHLPTSYRNGSISGDISVRDQLKRMLRSDRWTSSGMTVLSLRTFDVTEFQSYPHPTLFLRLRVPPLAQLHAVHIHYTPLSAKLRTATSDVIDHHSVIYYTWQASLLTRLRTGHTSLNQYLFHIRKVESPVCPHCRGLTVKTVRHLLVDCPFYRRERHTLQLKLKCNATSVSFSLSKPAAIEH
jgi:hypothetical protein